MCGRNAALEYERPCSQRELVVNECQVLKGTKLEWGIRNNGTSRDAKPQLRRLSVGKEIIIILCTELGWWASWLGVKVERRNASMDLSAAEGLA